MMKMFWILFYAVVLWVQDDLRIWTDSTGKFQVEAALVSSDGSKVTLRKANGEVIVVEVSRLSTASQNFLKRAAEFVKDYKRKEAELVFAESIVIFYKQVLETPLTEDQKRFVESRLAELEIHDSNKSALVDGEFLTPDEIAMRRIRCDALVDQWASLIKASLVNRKGIDTRSDTFKQAQKAITEAQKIQPFIRPDFELGLVNVLVTRDFDAAEKHFAECVKRARKYKPLFEQPVDRLNFARALGNLALLKIRENRADDAAELWAEFLTVDGATSEFCYNVSRVLKANAEGNVRLPASVMETFSVWNSQFASPNSDRSLGWLYMPYVLGGSSLPDNVRPKAAESREEGFARHSSGTGFIIAPGLLLTNRHVVQDKAGIAYDRFRLNWDPSVGKKPAYGELIASSKSSDLALLRFPDATLAGVPIRSDVKTGEEVLILGFPRTDVLGNAISVTKGLISKEPTADHPRIITDAIANPGNSGGPIIDEYGNAIGVLTWLTQGLDQNLSMGESGAVAVDFVREHRPDYEPYQLTSPRKTAEIADEYKQFIVRIETFVAVNRGGVRAAANSRSNNNLNADLLPLYTGHADTACLRCAGSGTAKCPNSACARGQVTKTTLRHDPIPNAPGRFKTTAVQFKENCHVCSGNGRVRCSGCGGDGEE